MAGIDDEMERPDDEDQEYLGALVSVSWRHVRVDYLDDVAVPEEA